MNRTLNKLRVTQPTPEYAANTCGPYWFLVTSNNTAETAFCRRESFEQWLAERGLTLESELAPHGEFKNQKIIGEYQEQSHLSYDEFFAVTGQRSRKLSNGKYTLAIITDGNNAVVHYLNPNCHDRPEFGYSESKAIYG